MGMSVEDYTARREELEAGEKHKQKTQQLHREFLNKQLRELLVDPKWEAYAQELDRLLVKAKDASDGLAQKMLEGDLDTFKKLMPDYRYNLGIKKAFEEALLIVKETQKA